MAHRLSEQGAPHVYALRQFIASTVALLCWAPGSSVAWRILLQKSRGGGGTCNAVLPCSHPPTIFFLVTTTTTYSQPRSATFHPLGEYTHLSSQPSMTCSPPRLRLYRRQVFSRRGHSSPLRPSRTMLLPSATYSRQRAMAHDPRPRASANASGANPPGRASGVRERDVARGRGTRM